MANISSSQEKNAIKSKLVEELILLAEEDQTTIIREFGKIEKINDGKVKELAYQKMATAAHKRAHRMMQILDKVGKPTIDNIGKDASEAALLIAQHSYLDIMKKILIEYITAYSKKKSSIPFTYVPSLIDRVMILEKKLQYYGTQWMLSESGKPFLVYTKNFETVNERRAEFGLGPIKKPTDLASKTNRHPLGIGNACKSDMQRLTDKDYNLYSKYYLKSLL
jgi:hypothetical protein